MSGSPLLPKITPGTFRTPSTVGKWNSLAVENLQNLANSLDSGGLNIKLGDSSSSIPNMWAWPLLTEIVLHTENHVYEKDITCLWRGILAVLALKESRRLDLSVVLVDLEQLKGNLFADSLSRSIPNSSRSLYSLDKDSGLDNPWKKIYLFLLNGAPIGMTSPSTIVCPSNFASLEKQWLWKKENGSISSPEIILSIQENIELKHWLEILSSSLSVDSLNEENVKSSRNTIQARLKGFISDIEKRLSDSGFTGDQALLRSSVKTSDQKLFSLENTCAEFPLLEALSRPIHRDDSYFDSDDIFLEDLFYVDREDAFPGAYSFSGINALKDKDDNLITPLLPLKPKILENIKLESSLSDDLIQFSTSRINSSIYVSVHINLQKLSINQNNSYYDKIIYKTFELKSENKVDYDDLPVIELWPHLSNSDWSEYYIFYDDKGKGENTFEISCLLQKSNSLASPKENEKEIHQFSNTDGAKCSIFKLKNFPRVIYCTSINDAGVLLKGALILRTGRSSVPSLRNWSVGVDFGTSFTNIFLMNGEREHALSFNSLHLKVTESREIYRQPSLFEYFFPPEYEEELKLPISTILTTRLSRLDRKTLYPSAILDGRIYVPSGINSYNSSPLNDWIWTDLKWSINDDKKYTTLFLKHLALYIGALAKAQGVKSLTWNFAFPSAFSRKDQFSYGDRWKSILEELEKSTGINNIFIDSVASLSISDMAKSTRFCPESLAAARYFREKYDLSNTICIDIGGGSSDISVWENDRILYQSSLRLAGQHLLTNILGRNPIFLKNVLGLSETEVIQQNYSDNRGGINSKIDFWLRKDGNEWLQLQREQARSKENEYFYQTLNLISVGFAGLCYYVGIVLGVLQSEGIHPSNRKSLRFIIGGNGSKILHWLSPNNTFNERTNINSFFNKMLNAPVNLDSSEPIRMQTILSSAPKEEVVRGLVTPSHIEFDTKSLEERTIIPGESIVINNKLCQWDSYLKLGNLGIQDVKIDDFSHFQHFLKSFNDFLDQSEIYGISTIQEIDNSDLLEDVRRLVQKKANAMRGAYDEVRLEPAFILILKAFLEVLQKRWLRV